MEALTTEDTETRRKLYIPHSAFASFLFYRAKQRILAVVGLGSLPFRFLILAIS